MAEKGAGAYRDGVRLHREVPEGDLLVGRTSRRDWIGGSFEGLPDMALTWVSCGIDYPKLVEGQTDYVLYRSAAPWDHAPGALLVSEAGGLVGQSDGSTYGPRDQPTGGLVAAASPAAYDRVCRALADGGPRAERTTGCDVAGSDTLRMQAFRRERGPRGHSPG